MKTTNKLDLNGLKKLTREATFDKATIDEKARTVSLSFASELPVERYYGMEVLSCDAKSCDMTRLMDGAPLLVNHDPNRQVGSVVSCSMGADKVGRAVVKFSRSECGEEIFQDVIDGIRGKTSVGYAINDVLMESETDGVKTYRATSWMPYEISLASIPADNSVGVGRSAEMGAVDPATTEAGVTEQIEKRNITMATETTVPVISQPDFSKERAAEVARVSEIRSIATHYKVEAARLEKAINEGESLNDFRGYILKDVVKATPVTVSPEIGMSEKEMRCFSIVKAVRDMTTGNRKLEGLEREASDATAKQIGRTTEGFFIPHDVAMFRDPRMGKRVMQASVAQSGGYTVQTDVLGGSLIELLRNKTLVASLGATQLGGLVGNVAIPKQTGAATAYWLAEGGSITASGQTFQQLGLTPKKLGAQTAYTKQLLAQSSIDTESFVREDLMKILAIAKDKAALYGKGGAEPLGIYYTPDIKTVTYSTTATWAKVLESEGNIASANADIGAMNWLSNPTVRQKWKGLAKATNYPVFLIDDKNICNGYPFFVTNQIPTTAAPVANQTFFGVWSELIMADWAGFDVVVDPYTQAASGQVVLTTSIFADIGVRHAEAFCVSTDTAAA